MLARCGLKPARQPKLPADLALVQVLLLNEIANWVLCR